jgi:hypothetical protein
VPTCGLAVVADRFTLAPSATREVQRHAYGVSPGHSGVPGRTTTLMSRSTP